jgi:KAP-like P-loop domain-containing protein
MARGDPQAGPESDGRFTLLGDQPHVEADDPLGFDKIAEDLTELVLSSRVSTPFTLGIEAGWGMGKSSLMRRLEHKLQARGVTSVWFNAWTSEEEDVLEGLIKSVLDRIDPSVLRRAVRNQQLMSWLRVAISIVAGWLRLGSLVDQVWRQVAVDPKTRNEMRGLMVDAMKRWMKQSPRGGDRLLVVFIDDLDRCSPANVFQVFEAIKLYLDAPGFVFVVGFDNNVISEAILERKQYSKAVTSRDYMEKIIQIGYRIPQAGDEQVEGLVESYVQDSRTADLFESSARSLVVERNARNPRRIKRFINGFILEYGLDREWEDIGAETLVKVLILYMYFPDFARLLDERAKDDPFTEFLGYCDVRSALRRGVGLDSQEWPAVVGALDAHDLAVPVEGEPIEHGALLRSIEEELPESFGRLAADDDFVSLVRSMGGPDDRERLRHKLERRRYVPSTPAGVTSAPGIELPSDVDLSGVQIAWLGTDPDRARPEIAAMVGRGAAVAPHEDVPSMLASGRSVDLVVVDIEAGDDEAGFRDLEQLRVVGYTGAKVLYTSRLTPTRRRAARRGGRRSPTTCTIWPRSLSMRRQRPCRPSATFAHHRKVRSRSSSTTVATTRGAMPADSMTGFAAISGRAASSWTSTPAPRGRTSPRRSSRRSRRPMRSSRSSASAGSAPPTRMAAGAWTTRPTPFGSPWAARWRATSPSFRCSSTARECRRKTSFRRSSRDSPAATRWS